MKVSWQQMLSNGKLIQTAPCVWSGTGRVSQLKEQLTGYWTWHLNDKYLPQQRLSNSTLAIEWGNSGQLWATDGAAADAGLLSWQQASVHTLPNGAQPIVQAHTRHSILQHPCPVGALLLSPLKFPSFRLWKSTLEGSECRQSNCQCFAQLRVKFKPTPDYVWRGMSFSRYIFLAHSNLPFGT